MEDIFHLGIKAVLRNDTGEILLLQVNPANLKGGRASYWDMPGGRVQRGDTVIDTLYREVEEETGIVGLRNPKEIGMALANIRIPLGESESAGLFCVFIRVMPRRTQLSQYPRNTKHISGLLPLKRQNCYTLNIRRSFARLLVRYNFRPEIAIWISVTIMLITKAIQVARLLLASGGVVRQLLGTL